MKDISVIVPVYNEEKNINPFLQRIEPILKQIGSYEILFCLDPSSDKTEEIIHQEILRNTHIGLLVFSRKFGQPAATIAGIQHCSGNSCVVIDVDLQDPPEVISKLYAKLQKGYDVVYAKRRSREGETFLKLFISWLGYKIMNKFAEVHIPRDTGDFRIFNRRVIHELKNLSEKNHYLRGLIGYVGFKQTYIEYDREKRVHGRGHYNKYLGSLKIGLNGLISYSNFPLSFLWMCGLFIMITSFSFIMIIMLLKWLIPAYASISLTLPFFLGTVLIFIGGQFLCIGLLGEYIGRIYEEVKGRPSYIIDKKINIQES